MKLHEAPTNKKRNYLFTYIYLGLPIIPLLYISWLIFDLIRNLNEQKDTLLSLDGNCDL